jgi:hydrogenase maturation protease
VRAVDYGIRGLHLAFELLDRPDLLVVVDALPRGETPGTVTLLDPDVEGLPAAPGDAHGMDLPSVFSQVRLMGGELPPLRIVGCEPGDVGEGMGLTPAVEAAIGPAVNLVLKVTGREVSSWTRS